MPLLPEQLDAALGRAESEGMSHLEFLRALISEQANGRRERALARRIRAAGFAQIKTLADFDWQFNAEVIDRVRIETLAGGEFIGRRQNLVWVGPSGVGKSHLIQAIGHRACVLGYRVRYETSGSVLQDLTAALADHTLPRMAGFAQKLHHLGGGRAFTKGRRSVARPGSTGGDLAGRGSGPTVVTRANVATLFPCVPESAWPLALAKPTGSQNAGKMPQKGRL
jgi:hypothetical protein